MIIFSRNKFLRDFLVRATAAHPAGNGGSALTILSGKQRRHPDNNVSSRGMAGPALGTVYRCLYL